MRKIITILLLAVIAGNNLTAQNQGSFKRMNENQRIKPDMKISERLLGKEQNQKRDRQYSEKNGKEFFQPPKPAVHLKSEDWYEPDTICTYKDDGTPNERYIFTYKNGERGTDLQQQWNGTEWENYWTLIRSYDSRNNLTEELYKEWESGQWVVSQKNNYAYDTRNNRIEEMYQSKDWETGKLDINQKNFLEYDSKNNLKVFLSQNRDWDTGQVVDYSKTLYDYDERNNETEWLLKVWEGGQWIDDQRYTHTYNAQNNMTEEISEYRDWETGLLVNSMRGEWTYTQNNLTEELSQRWDTESGQWESNVRTTYQYDAQDNMTEELRQNWDTESEQWTNSSKYILKYDTQNNLKEFIAQWADWDTGLLVNATKSIFDYDTQNNLTEELGQDWDVESKQWIDSWKYSYEYDTQNNLTEELGQDWYSESEQWINSVKLAFTYDENHNTTSGFYQQWEDNTWVNENRWFFMIFYNNRKAITAVSNCHKFVVSYVKAGTVSILENTFSNSIKIYPNPVLAFLNIETGNNDIVPEVKIYSVQGILLLKTKGNWIDMTSFSNGIYIVDVNGQTMKVLKQ